MEPASTAGAPGVCWSCAGTRLSPRLRWLWRRRRPLPGRPPCAGRCSRARTRGGSWVTLHAWHTRETGQTTIAIGPTQPGELAALILEAYPFTARERQITQLVLLGRSTAEMAAELGVSAHTVQDHLKRIFEKTGVRSRRDLVADVFFQHYLPQLANPPLTTDGRLTTVTS